MHSFGKSRIDFPLLNPFPSTEWLSVRSEAQEKFEHENPRHGCCQIQVITWFLYYIYITIKFYLYHKYNINIYCFNVNNKCRWYSVCSSIIAGILICLLFYDIFILFLQLWVILLKFNFCTLMSLISSKKQSY